MPKTATADAGTMDAEDVQRADAFRRLADDHLEDSYRLANAILGSPIDARDAVHDAFILGWQRWPSLRDQERFGTWFRRIVVNTCKDRLRKEARRRPGPAGAARHPSEPDLAVAVHDRLQIEEGLGRLKPDDRIVLALRYYRDLKVEQIADLLDIPTGTANSRLRNAHTRLRRIIERSEPKGVTR